MTGRHHVPFRFVCTRGLCNRAFKNRSGLTQHIHRAHPPPSPPLNPASSPPRSTHSPEVQASVSSPPAPFVYPERRNPDAYAFLDEEEEDRRAFDPYKDYGDDDKDEDEDEDTVIQTHEPETATRYKTHPVLDGNYYFCLYLLYYS